MNFIKTIVIFIVASAALAGIASASSIYSTTTNSHSISQQMTNVVSKNNEATDQQFTK
ncbi:hypothetical protein [Limosilactobacillus sp.]|jgi:hypothetical protein|uniref:hypothetical protein n=1 Tax=Limosilactobacillus sp. TaxID=2773925 RepID=UPI0025C431B5|nr:hypothetical protein [Limosilactobacillus sp.]MCH3923002.1 hypothetical protein [Limosilactobacillus sp.]MCH3927685.1 hypothetical protein [Limosilactobacillus sp.]